MKPITYFVCGAIYGDKPNSQFELVNPSNRNAPYVTIEGHEQALYRFCEHHSGLYRLNPDGQTLTLVSQANALTCRQTDLDFCPKTVTLRAEQVVVILAQITNGNIIKL